MKRLIKYSFIFFVCCVLLVMLLHARIERYAGEYLVQKIEETTGCHLELSQVSLSLPLNLNIEKCHATMDGKPFIDIEKLHVVINPWKLLQQQFVIYSVSAEKLFLNPLTQTGQPLLPMQWKLLPADLSIGVIQISQAWIAGGVLNIPPPYQNFFEKSMPLALKGNLKIDSVTKNILAELTVAEAAHPQDSIQGILSISQETIKTQLRIILSEDFSIRHALPLSQGYAIQTFMQAEGSEKTWLNFFDQSEYEDFLTGYFHISYTSPHDHGFVPFLGTNGSLISPLAFSTRHAIHLSDLKGNIGPNAIFGGLFLSPDQLLDGTHFTLLLKDNRPFLDIMPKDLQLACELSGQLFDPEAKISLKSSHVQFQEHFFENVLIDGNCHYTGECFKGTIAGQGNLFEKEIQTKADYSWKNGQFLKLTDLSLISGISSILGQLDIDLNHSLFSGEIRGKTELALLEPSAKGFIDFQARFFHKDNKQKVTFTINAPDIHLNDFSAENITFHASALDPLGNFQLTDIMTASCKTAHWNGWSLENITCESSFNPFQLTLNAGANTSVTELNASMQAILQNDCLICKGRILGMGPQPIDLTAQLPFEITSNPFKISPKLESPMNIHFAQTGKIESLLEFFLPTATTLITGQTSLGIDITGSFQQPITNGQLHLTDGTFELLDLGLALKNVQGTVDLRDNQVTIKELKGQGSDGGSVLCSGSGELNSSLDHPFALNFHIDNVGISPFHYTSGIAAGELQLKGNVHGALLQGNMTLDNVDITIPDQVPALAQTVEITYINQSSAVPLPTLILKTAPKWPLTYNITFHLPQHGTVHGRDWTSEWEGNVTLTGAAEAPLFNGICKVIKGEYRFNGKEFDINEGSVTFAGDFDKKTSLYVIASRDLGEITADIILKGPIKHPEITFRSNPPLSQREIVSWILFGSGSSDITPFQGTQLNDSITDLSAANKQPDLLTKLRNRIGIDRIDITRDDTGTSNEVSVKVGKYISHGIFVSVNKSISAEANRVAIEANVIKNVKVQAEIGDDSAGQLLLKWKHDY